MGIGSIATGLVTGLREGVEAALVVSIILVYLARTGHASQSGRVWLGVGAAVAASAAIGIALFATVGEFRSPYEQLFEAATMLAAAAVVTWMLFWMRRQAATVSAELRAAVDRAISEGGLWALAVLAFVAVIREGIETALFLVGQASAASTGPTDAGAGSGSPLGILVGAVAGLAIAAVLGVGFYHGTRRIDLGRFFRWTGIALILIAAGLVASAIHELVEIGVVTVGTATAFDLGGLLPSSEEAGNLLGMLLGALFGYRSAPEVVAMAGWATYLVATLALYLRPVAHAPKPPAVAQTPAPSAPLFRPSGPAATPAGPARSPRRDVAPVAVADTSHATRGRDAASRR